MLPCCVVIQTALIIILDAFAIVNTFSKLSWQIFLHTGGNGDQPRPLALFYQKGSGEDGLYRDFYD